MSKWTHVRVSVELKAELDAEIARLKAAHERGGEVGPDISESNKMGGFGISHDALIRWLLRYRQRQRRRKGKSQRKGKGP